MSEQESNYRKIIESDLPHQLANEHWAWIEQVLANRQTETKHMFIEGFLHGYKHGKESKVEVSHE